MKKHDLKRRARKKEELIIASYAYKVCVTYPVVVAVMRELERKLKERALRLDGVMEEAPRTISSNTNRVIHRLRVLSFAFGSLEDMLTFSQRLKLQDEALQLSAHGVKVRTSHSTEGEDGPALPSLAPLPPSPKPSR